jgi:ABC-2 type transport system permease protein
MGQVLFGIIMKSSFWLMLVATSLYVLVALTLGLLISVLTKSQLVANQIAILITYLPSLLLSDFVFPSENMPAALQIVTKIIPATYYIDILNGIYLRGVGIDFLWLDFLVLLAMFAILAALNVFRLKREGM